MTKTKIIFLLSVFFVSGFLLRTLYLSQHALTFGYDQARDAYISNQIVAGDFKILGPPASTPGLFHGVFYYYVLAIPYAISSSPIIAAYWIAFLNSAAIFIVFYLAFVLTKNVYTGLLASLFFAASFETSQYALWLSNPTLGVWTVPLVYIGLWVWLKNKNKWGPIIAGLGLGLSVQSEIFLAYHGVPILIWLWVSRSKVEFRKLVSFILSFLIATSTMILVEFKFGFQSIRGISSLLTTSDTIVKSQHFGDFVLLYLDQLGKVFANNLFPLNLGYGALLGFILLGLALRKANGYSGKQIFNKYAFISSYILSHLSVVTVGGTSTPFLLVGIGSGVAVLAALMISDLWKTSRSLAFYLIIVIVLANIGMIARENKKGQTIFSIQKDMLLRNELQALDYTYATQGEKMFSTNSLTSPLWMNTVWSYLYTWYGEEKYGYIPEWHGKDQIGQLSNNLPAVSVSTSDYYLILEPLQGIPRRYLDEAIAEEESRSTLIEEKNFGELIIQKRIKNEKTR